MDPGYPAYAYHLRNQVPAYVPPLQDSIWPPWRNYSAFSYFSPSFTETQNQVANTNAYVRFSGLDQIPRQYRLLVHQTKAYINVINQLARLPDHFLVAARMLVGFATKILMGKGSCFRDMLNSQQCHLLWLLDDALLRLCLDEWEKPSLPSSSRKELPWPTAIAPLYKHISESLSMRPGCNDSALEADHGVYLGWAWRAGDEDYTPWMVHNFFSRTRKFIDESEEVHDVKKRVNLCLKERLPKELADKIIDDVLHHEGLPAGRMRLKYFPKGKEKAN